MAWITVRPPAYPTASPSWHRPYNTVQDHGAIVEAGTGVQDVRERLRCHRMCSYMSSERSPPLDVARGPRRGPATLRASSALRGFGAVQTKSRVLV